MEFIGSISIDIKLNFSDVCSFDINYESADVDKIFIIISRWNCDDFDISRELFLCISQKLWFFLSFLDDLI